METGPPLPTYGEKRRCTHPDCKTILTKYNPTNRCHTHQGDDFFPPLGKSTNGTPLKQRGRTETKIQAEPSQTEKMIQDLICSYFKVDFKELCRPRIERRLRHVQCLLMYLLLTEGGCSYVRVAHLMKQESGATFQSVKTFKEKGRNNFREVHELRAQINSSFSSST